MKKILLAGATGYLGKYILSELLRNGYDTRIVVRNENKIPEEIKNNSKVEIIKAELTKPGSIKDCCNDIDVIITTVGITRQKDQLSYMDVDYQANLNLLNEAKQKTVKKFIYVSLLNGEKLRHLEICRAKERFVDELKVSGLEYCVIRPNGYFSDMAEFFKMAKNGRIFLFGDGEFKSNPIHGEDLAKECVHMVESRDKELAIGGPEILTQNEIAKIAFESVNRKPKIIHIPGWVRIAVLKITKIILPTYKFGPIEFFMNVMAMEMIAPKYGRHTLRNYFEELNKKTDS